MFQNNLWALSRYDAPILTVIYNNRCYNLNRAAAFGGGGRQAKLGKDIVTYLGNPDVNFADYARAFKIDAEVVEDPAELAGAIQRGLNATKEGKPYLLDVVVKKWGPQPEDTYHPDWSIAEMRTRKI